MESYQLIEREKQMKNILITGGSKGIGLALVKKFLAANYNVITVARTNIKEIEECNNNLTFIKGDLTDINIQQRILYEASKFEEIGFISNAALIEPERLLTTTDVHLIERHAKTNFLSPVSLILGLLNTVEVSKVINISTGAAQMAIESMMPYCTSKAAMHMAINCFALEYPVIGFANVRPGIVDTPNQEYMRNLPSTIFPSKTNIYEKFKNENKLISPTQAANFIFWVYNKSCKEISSAYWDINDFSVNVYQ